MAVGPVRETGFETSLVGRRLGMGGDIRSEELEVVHRARAICDVVTAHLKPVPTLASHTKVKAGKVKWSISLNEESRSGDVWGNGGTNLRIIKFLSICRLVIRLTQV